ncbi:acyl-CoA dehydrogenase family protein [Synechococcus sp. CS-603]|uniref:acyl-CoA dehydrogenase family protein n=1 Tax=Synechococcus sp. CS-603 TaxID=2847981 RepID=UPI00223B614B|nr:acyl-CoA dehydrogenase family protein [Synechococcus sp. CS-603]MCT0202812.1 acyl-CoA/acyl-ACP dehydrogenase [Synechococcus sp. CS-603]
MSTPSLELLYEQRAKCSMTLKPSTGPGEISITKALSHLQRPFRTPDMVGVAMRALLANKLADLPRPADGRTLQRWQALAEVGANDLSLAKVYEGHTDALAILAEHHGPIGQGIWAVWAAETPQSRVKFLAGKHGGALYGTKAWCSGAALADSALMTAWTQDEQPILVALQLRQPGLRIETQQWNAVGMSATESATVILNGVPAVAVGGQGEYGGRPGFWQGGAGIAAVWYGATVAIAKALATSSKVASDPHAAAHLGAMDSTLRAARALLIETATWIDTHPMADTKSAALRVRATVESTANDVLQRTGRALGPGLLCSDAIHAQRCADLPVFLRQSHAEHDLAALGQSVKGHSARWSL